MGRFIVSRNASGVRFLLESDKGRTLAVSKEYATLDAAKKGICSLVYYAPIAPLVDTTLGERAPNPKLEIFGAGQGFAYALKSANGKSVITQTGFATRKACLRAAAMLRTGVLGAEVVFSNPAGLTPLTVGGMVRDPAPAEATSVPPAVDDAFLEEPYEPTADLDCAADEPLPAFDDTADEPFDGIPAEVSPAPHEEEVPAPAVPTAVKETPPATRVPRRVTLKGEGALTPRTTGQAPKPVGTTQEKAKKNGVLSRFFKR